MMWRVRLLPAAPCDLRRWGGGGPRCVWLTAIGNSGAMTLYLWHLPGAAGHATWCSTNLGHPAVRPGLARVRRALGGTADDSWGALVAVVFVTLRPLGEQPAAAVGMAGFRRAAGARAARAVGRAAGASPVACDGSRRVGWGLKDQGPLLHRG